MGCQEEDWRRGFNEGNDRIDSWVLKKDHEFYALDRNPTQRYVLYALAADFLRRHSGLVVVPDAE